MSKQETLDVTKTHLGKLLATENIRIEHQNVQGPYFDVKQRLLVLPIWKNIDADLYDLMIGHEVGHALFTPTDGWMDLAEQYGDGFKVMLNLVEDARIEKKMKRKYPGLRRPMYNGYTQLVEKGFFGLSLEEMKYLPFADRVNCYFKLGARTNISFTDDEKNFVDRLENAETWDEIVELALELFEITKNEKNNLSESLSDLIEQLNEGDGDVAGNFDNLPADLKEGIMKGSYALRERMGSWANDNKISSITDDALTNNQKKLIDEKSNPYLYLKMGKCNISDYVIPASIFHDNLSRQFHPSFIKYASTIRQSFMSTNKKFIDNMVKEFEMRRNAKQFAKVKVSKTGDLNEDKLWKYSISEDLFKQATIVPNGKNHGVIMVVDMSGSMQDNISGTIEQVISMAMFCRKVNIPFDVYTFIDNAYIEAGYQKKIETRNVTRRKSENMSLVPTNPYFRMQHLISSRMKFTEFNKAIDNLLLLSVSNSNRNYYQFTDAYIFTPKTVSLSGTPLDEAIFVLRSLADDFREKNKVEILNTIILTDGDGSYGLQYISPDGYDYVPQYSHNIVIQDTATKKQINFSSSGRSNITSNLLKVFKEATGCRVIGYYLMSSRNHKTQISRKYWDHYGRYQKNTLNHEIESAKYTEKFAKDKFVSLPIPGYDEYYMIPGGNLEIDDINLDAVLSGKAANKNNLYKAFKKMQNTKLTSRTFVTRFIESIS